MSVSPLLQQLASQGSRRFTTLLLATVSTFGVIPEALAATQTITGTYSGASGSQTYETPVNATGALMIKGGAQVSAPAITGGAPPAGAALMMVSGVGSQLVTQGNLIIGAAPDAYTGTTLSVSSGGSVSASAITAGLGDGTLGTINLSGYSSGNDTRLVTGNLTLGAEAGNAALNVLAQTGGTATVQVNGQLVIGRPDADNGLGANSVQISGPGATLEVGGTNGIQATGTSGRDYSFTLSGGTLKDIGSDLTSSVNMTLGSNSNSTIDTGAFNTRLEGTITGSGNLIKAGSGTLTLTGDNQYAHGAGAPVNTTIQSGTLASSPLSLRGVGSIQDNATLVIDQDNYTGTKTTWADMVSNTISGTGSVVKDGEKSVTLTSTNTYTGETIVRQGTLQLGYGGTTGSIDGTSRIQLVDASSNLTIDRSDNLTLAPSVSGAGSVTKQGADALTLGGTNTYTGGTNLNQGTLIGNASSFGTGAIRTAQGTTLEIDQPADGILTNDMTGAGQLQIQSAGILGYTGDASTFTGTTDLQQGTLSVTGDMGQSDITAAQGTVLNGTGTIGSTEIYGTFAPGQTASSQFGTMRVNGNVTMETGSRLAASVGPDLASSQAAVAGSFIIEPGATLAVTALEGANLYAGQHYTLVQASGGVSGSFAHYDQTGLIETHSLLEVAQPGYSNPDEVQIVLERNRTLSFGYGAGTRNEKMTGFGLDSIAENLTASPLTDLVAGLGDNQRYRALTALSGEIYASAKTAMVNDSFYIRNAALDRLDCVGSELRRQTTGEHSGICDVAAGHALSVWGTVYGSTGHNGAVSGTVGLNDSSVGWIMGADTQAGNWRFGGLLAYGRTMYSNGGSRNSAGHSNNATLGLYGGTAWRVGGINPDARVTLKLGADYTWNVMNTHRDIRIPGYDTRTTSNSLGGTGQVYGESGYRFAVNTARLPVELEPFVRMAYVNYQADGFHENGNIAALRVRGMDQSIGYSAFGLKAATSFRFANMTVAPHLNAAYRRAFGMTNMTAQENFRLAAQSQGYSMDVEGAPIAINTAVVQTGMTVRLAQRLTMTMDYIGQYGGRMTTSGGSGKITYNW